MKRSKWGLVLLVMFLMCTMTACAETSKSSKEIDAGSAAETASKTVSGSAASSSEDSEHYQLGDKVDDFTVTMSDGTKVVLSDLLKEKKMIFINFWASWCGPCKMEFLAMQEAYTEMSDEVAVVALSKEKTDTDDKINAVKDDLGLTTLPLGKDSIDLMGKFVEQDSAIPVSFVVDRNGILCFKHVTIIDTKEKFVKLFKVYTDSEYDEPVLLDDLPPLVDAPAQPSADEMRTALGITDDNIKVQIPEDTKLWPFYPSEDDSYVKATNDKVAETTASVGVSVSAKAGQALAFDYIAYSDVERLQDILSVLVNGEETKGYLHTPDWKTSFIEFDETGEYTVDFNFVRDLSLTNDVVEADARIANLHVIEKEEVDRMKAAEPDYPKILSGSEMEIEVAEGDMRQIEYTGYEQVKKESLRKSLEAKTSWMLLSDEATLRVKIGEEIDPTQSNVSWNGVLSLLSELEYDEEGYLVHIKKSDPVNEIIGTCYMSGFPAIGVDVKTSFFIEWCTDEKQIDDWIQSKKDTQENCENLGWKFADDTKADEGIADKTEAKVSGKSNYVITVVDEKGKPVKDAALQICDDSSCAVDKTDAKGVVNYEGKSYAYEVHVLKVPEGYAEDTTVYHMEEAGGELEIVLKQK